MIAIVTKAAAAGIDRPHIIALNLALMPEAWAGLLFLVVRHAPPEVGSTRNGSVEKLGPVGRP